MRGHNCPLHPKRFESLLWGGPLRAGRLQRNRSNHYSAHYIRDARLRRTSRS